MSICVYVCLCLFVCVCLCVYMCLTVFVCVCLYVSMWVCWYMCLYVRMPVYLCISICVCVYLSICICMYICAYVCVCLCLYVSIFVCVYGSVPTGPSWCSLGNSYDSRMDPESMPEPSGSLNSHHGSTMSCQSLSLCRGRCRVHPGPGWALSEP